MERQKKLEAEKKKKAAEEKRKQDAKTGKLEKEMEK